MAMTMSIRQICSLFTVSNAYDTFHSIRNVQSITALSRRMAVVFDCYEENKKRRGRVKKEHSPRNKKLLHLVRSIYR